MRSAQSRDRARRQFKVVCYNIREGGDGRLAEIAEVIDAQQPHAVALVEANSRSNAEWLARELHMGLCFGEANNGRSILKLTQRARR